MPRFLKPRNQAAPAASTPSKPGSKSSVPTLNFSPDIKMPPGNTPVRVVLYATFKALKTLYPTTACPECPPPEFRHDKTWHPAMYKLVDEVHGRYFRDKPIDVYLSYYTGEYKRGRVGTEQDPLEDPRWTKWDGYVVVFDVGVDLKAKGNPAVVPIRVDRSLTGKVNAVVGQECTTAVNDWMRMYGGPWLGNRLVVYEPGQWSQTRIVFGYPAKGAMILKPVRC